MFYIQFKQATKGTNAMIEKTKLKEQILKRIKSLNGEYVTASFVSIETNECIEFISDTLNEMVNEGRISKTWLNNRIRYFSEG